MIYARTIQVTDVLFVITTKPTRWQGELCVLHNVQDTDLFRRSTDLELIFLAAWFAAEQAQAVDADATHSAAS